MDGVILEGFLFNGKMKKYLTELNFEEARGIFMARYRMWPTKVNYPGRWNGVSCNVCGLDQSLPSPRSINNREPLLKEAQNYQVYDY